MPVQNKFSFNFVCMMLLAFYIAIFCFIGIYTYPSADDCNFFSAITSNGFWYMQILYFTSWTGRVTNTFLVSTAIFSGWIKLYPFLPTVNALLNLSALYALLSVSTPLLPVKNKIITACLFQAISFAVLPFLNETFYWLSGMPYTWTATFFLFVLAGLIKTLKEGKTGLTFWLTLFVIFFNGMILEPTCIAQILLFFFMTVYFLYKSDKLRASHMFVFFTVAFAALLVMYLAPGTSARMGATAPFMSRFLRTIGVAASFGGITALKFFTKPVIYVFLLFLPSIAQALQPFDSKISRRLRTWHIVFLTALIAPLMHSIAGWATGAGLPERAESLTLWMMGLTWVLMWSFGYRNEAFFERVKALRLFRWRGALLVLCLLLSSNFIALIKDLQIAPIYRSELAARDAMVQQEKSKGHLDITVPLLTVKPKLLFFSDLRPSSLDWKNASYAEYHGINSVSALPIKIFTDEAEKRAFESGSLEGFKKLAAKGDSETPFMLGEIYDTTFAELKGITKDNAEAAKWYLMAAERSNTHACRRLTRLYATGSGVPKNYLTAVYWLLRAQL